MPVGIFFINYEVIFMKLKKGIVVLTIFAMLISMISISFADPTTDFHTGPLPGETEEGANGPEVVEYMVYKDDRNIAPGSLSGDVDLNTVGKGLFFDGTDFYLFIDTGVMAQNYMYTIEGDRFFFGENGKMVKDELVDYNGELYYFDLNGAMYKNRWYSAEELDESENVLVYTDYYFGPTGRAYRALDGGTGLIIKTIDGQKFGFNVDGEKLEGYCDQNGNIIDPALDPAYVDCVYYFDPDENGAAATGWHFYEGSTRSDEYDDNEEIVLYFDEKTCRKVAAKASYAEQGRCVSRIIEGQRYMFDSNGVRKNSWYTAEPGRATNSNMKYFNEEMDGYLQKGWFLAVPGSFLAKGEDLKLEVNKKKHKEEEECWFYAGKNGNILRKTIRKIGNYIYAFDDDGVMQYDAFVKVKNGAFVKSYSTDDVNRANILLDPAEYGGNADPYVGVNDYADSAGLIDKEKGILKVDEGEQWMYFLGDYEGESKLGSQIKQNKEVKIEVSDSDVYFIQNSVGGYAKYEEGITLSTGTAKVTTVVERGGQYIQNGVVLRPSPDDNDYGVVRRWAHKTEHGSMLNYKNEVITPAATDYYVFYVVNSKGSPITASNKSFKDKNGNYIYVGSNGEFIGYYPYQGKYYSKTPSNLVYEDGTAVPSTNNPCWAYKKDGDKKWTYGLPPEAARITPESLALNYNANSLLGSGSDFGPYEYGIASAIYQEATP